MSAPAPAPVPVPTGSVAAVADAVSAAIGAGKDVFDAYNAGDMKAAAVKAREWAFKAQLAAALLAQADNPSPANQTKVLEDLGE